MKWLLRNGGATFLRNITDTVQTVQYSDSQCTQQQYWHERQRCSWLHKGLYCIAPRPFTRFVFLLPLTVTSWTEPQLSLACLSYFYLYLSYDPYFSFDSNIFYWTIPNFQSSAECMCQLLQYYKTLHMFNLTICGKLNALFTGRKRDVIFTLH